MSVRPAPDDSSPSVRNEAASESDPETLRLRMREIRDELQSDVDGVVDRAGELADWRYYVRKHPWASVAVAAAVGYWLVPKGSSGGKRGTSSAGVESSSAADQSRDRPVGDRSNLGDGGASRSEGESASSSESGSAERGWLVSAAAVVGPILLRAGTTYLSQRIARAMEEPSSGGQSTGDGVASPEVRAEGASGSQAEGALPDVASGGG